MARDDIKREIVTMEGEEFDSIPYYMQYVVREWH